MKYVMFRAKSGWLFPVLFPDHVAHSQVVLEECTPVSGGFVNPRTGECSGKASSYRLASRQADTPLVVATLVDNGSAFAALNVELVENERETREGKA